MENKAANQEPKIRVIAYCRYSSTGQNPVSIEIQKQNICKYCEENNMEIINVYIDEAKTGTNTKREGYQKMLAYLVRNKSSYDGVIVDQLDRVNRNEIDYYALKGILYQNNSSIFSVKESNIDQTPEGLLQEGIICSVAAYTSRIIARRAVQGLIQKAKSAMHCGGLPPLGYTQDETGKLVIKEEDAAAVRLIFGWYEEGYGYEAIARKLNDKGFLTQRKMCFRKGSIHDILTNEKYIGSYVYNKAEAKKNGKRNSHRQKAEEEIIKIRNNHEPIISKALFERVQEIMSKKEKRSNFRKENYILSGLVHCKQCGRSMTGSVSYSGAKKKKYSIYKCPQKAISGCTVKSVNRYHIEGFILCTLQAYIFDNNDMEALVKKINDELRNSSEERRELDRFLTNLKIVTLQIERLHKVLPNVNKETIQLRILKSLEKLDNDKDVLENKIQQLNKIISKEFIIAEIKTAIDNFVDYMLKSRNDIAKEFLRSYIKDIQVDNNSILIIFHDGICYDDNNIQSA